MREMLLKLPIVLVPIFLGTVAVASADGFGNSERNFTSAFFTPAPMKNVEVGSSLMMIQSPVYGERCVTEIGSCVISPQPVGSPCQCGEVNGTTLQ